MNHAVEVIVVYPTDMGDSAKAQLRKDIIAEGIVCLTDFNDQKLELVVICQMPPSDVPLAVKHKLALSGCQVLNMGRVCENRYVLICGTGKAGIDMSIQGEKAKSLF